MKKFLLCLFLISSVAVQAQPPRGFSFQGFAVDPDGKALSSTSITVKFTVYDKVTTSQTYTEEQVRTTDPYGVFNAVIGSGVNANFQALKFDEKSDFWLKVEVKKTAGGSYIVVSDARVEEVPYSRFAGNGVPVGTIVPFAGAKDKVPAGWVLCDGRQLSGTDARYKPLYDVIGLAWGGAGTNFNVPDLRGLFLRGVNDTKTGAMTDPEAGSRTAIATGGNTGNNVGSYQADVFKEHNHGVTDPGHVHRYNDIVVPDDAFLNATLILAGWSAATDTLGNQYTNYRGRAGDNTDSNNNFPQMRRRTETSFTGISINNMGNTQETRPRNAAVNYIIKL